MDIKKNWEELHQEGFFTKLGFPSNWLKNPSLIEPINLQLEIQKLEREKIVKGFIELNRSMAVGVIGSGFGIDEEWLWKYVGKIKGCDISRKAIEIANKRFTNHSNVNFYEVNGKDLDVYQNNSLDFIFSITVFQHIPRYLTKIYFKEFHRILKPKGNLLIQFLSGEGFNHQDANEEKKEPSIGYSIKQIQELFDQLVLKKTEICYENNYQWIWAFGVKE